MSEIEKVTLSAAPAISELQRLKKAAKDALDALEKPVKGKRQQVSNTALRSLKSQESAISNLIEQQKAAVDSFSSLTKAQISTLGPKTVERFKRANKKFVTDLESALKEIQSALNKAAEKGLKVPEVSLSSARKTAKKIASEVSGKFPEQIPMRGIPKRVPQGSIESELYTGGPGPSLRTRAEVQNISRTPARDQVTNRKTVTGYQKNFESQIRDNLAMAESYAKAGDAKNAKRFYSRASELFSLRGVAESEARKSDSEIAQTLSNTLKRENILREKSRADSQGKLGPQDLMSKRASILSGISSSQSEFAETLKRLDSPDLSGRETRALLDDLQKKSNKVISGYAALDSIDRKVANTTKELRRISGARSETSRLTNLISSKGDGKGAGRNLSRIQSFADSRVQGINNRLFELSGASKGAPLEQALEISRERASLLSQRSQLSRVSQSAKSRLESLGFVSESRVPQLKSTLPGAPFGVEDLQSKLKSFQDSFLGSHKEYLSLSRKNIQEMTKAERRSHKQKMQDLVQSMERSRSDMRSYTKSATKEQLRIMSQSISADRSRAAETSRQLSQPIGPNTDLYKLMDRVQAAKDIQQRNEKSFLEAQAQIDRSRGQEAVIQSQRSRVSQLQERYTDPRNQIRLQAMSLRLESDLEMATRRRIDSEKKISELKSEQRAISRHMLQTERALNKSKDTAFKSLTNFRQITLTGLIAGAAITTSLTPVIRATIDAEKALNALNRQTRLSGIIGDKAQNTVENLDIVRNGLISIADASVAVRNLMRIGFSFDEAVGNTRKITEIALENKQSALTLGEAVRSTTEGFRQENSVLADAGGITENISRIYAKFASTIGKTAESLSQREKALAIMKEIEKEATISAGALESQMSTLGGAVDSTAGALVLLQQTLGKALKETILAVLGQVKDLIKAFQKLAAEYPDAISGFSKLAVAVGVFVAAIGSLVATGFLIAGVVTGVSALVAYLSPFLGVLATKTAVFGAVATAVGAVTASLFGYAEAQKSANISTSNLIKSNSDLNYQYSESKKKLEDLRKLSNNYTLGVDRSKNTLDTLKSKFLEMSEVQEDMYLKGIVEGQDFGSKVGHVWEVLKSKIEGANAAQKEFLQNQASAKILDLQEKLKTQKLTKEQNVQLTNTLIGRVQSDKTLRRLGDSFNTLDPQKQSSSRMLLQKALENSEVGFGFDMFSAIEEDGVGIWESLIGPMHKAFGVSQRFSEEELRRLNAIMNKFVAEARSDIEKQLEDLYAITSGSNTTGKDPSIKTVPEAALKKGVDVVMARTIHDAEYRLKELFKLGRTAVEEIKGASNKYNPYNHLLESQKSSGEVVGISNLADILSQQIDSAEAGDISSVKLPDHINAIVSGKVPEFAKYIKELNDSLRYRQDQINKFAKQQVKTKKQEDELTRLREKFLQTFSSYSGPSEEELRKKLQEMSPTDPGIRGVTEQISNVGRMKSDAAGGAEQLFRSFVPKSAYLLDTQEAIKAEAEAVKNTMDELNKFAQGLPESIRDQALSKIQGFNEKLTNKLAELSKRDKDLIAQQEERKRNQEKLAKQRESMLLQFSTYSGPSEGELLKKLSAMSSTDPGIKDIDNQLSNVRRMQTDADTSAKAMIQTIKLRSSTLLNSSQVIQEEISYIQQSALELRKFANGLPESVQDKALTTVDNYIRTLTMKIMELEQREQKLTLAKSKLEKSVKSRSAAGFHLSSSSLFNANSEFFSSGPDRDALVGQMESIKGDPERQDEANELAAKIELIDKLSSLRSKEIGKMQKMFKEKRDRDMYRREDKEAEILRIKEYVAILKEYRKELLSQGVLEEEHVDTLDNMIERQNDESERLNRSLVVEKYKEGVLRDLERSLKLNAKRKSNVVSAWQESASVASSAGSIAANDLLPEEVRDQAATIRDNALAQMSGFMDRDMSNQENEAFGEISYLEKLDMFKQRLQRELNYQIEHNSKAVAVHEEYARRISDIDQKIQDKRLEMIRRISTSAKEALVDNLMEMVNENKKISDVLFDTFKTFMNNLNKLIIQKAVEKSFIGKLFDGLTNAVVGNVGKPAASTGKAATGVTIQNNISVTAMDAASVSDVLSSSAGREAMTQSIVDAQKSGLIGAGG